MARGRGEAEWARAKSLAEAIRSCWVDQPLPEQSMNPYFEKPAIPFKVKLRLLMESFRARYGGDRCQEPPAAQ